MPGPGDRADRIADPSPSGATTTAPYAAGWYIGPVTVHFSCTDDRSGVATCPADQVVSTEGSNQTITGTAVDVAGNTASYVVSGVNRKDRDGGARLDDLRGNAGTQYYDVARGLDLETGPWTVLIWCQTFGVPGTYSYRCSIHPDMNGAVIVQS